MDDDPRAFTPTDIRQRSETELAITWADGRESVYPVRALRLSCGCARCVDEWTGDALLDPSRVPDDLRVTGWRPTGRYGVSLTFSDGHNTGIYTLKHLRELCPCPECSAGS